MTRRVVEGCLRYPYVWWIRPHIRTEIGRQRLRLFLFGWGYLPLLGMKEFRVKTRLELIRQFLRIDWHVLHSHRPAEIANICRVLAERRAIPGEVVVEAGCWRGGSSAKLSILCRLLGFRLHVYDSFLGVHAMSDDEWEHDFSGQYAASEDIVEDTLRRYGEPEICSLHKGWFRDTLAKGAVGHPVRAAYIDCDTADGTLDVLRGVVPNLVADGIVFSQDMHLPTVRELLSSSRTWVDLRRGTPRVIRPCTKLGVFRFAPVR